MTTPAHSSSVALVQAKIEQNRRIKEEAAQTLRENRERRFIEYAEFWKPLITELQTVAAAYPGRLLISVPNEDLSAPYRLIMGDAAFNFAQYTGGRVGMACRMGRHGSIVAASKEELLPQLLEFIANRLS